MWCESVIQVSTNLSRSGGRQKKQWANPSKKWVRSEITVA